MVWFGKKLKTLNRIEISGESILKNLASYKSKMDGEIWPVLKANAYGHGLKEVASILKNQKIKYLVVDSYYEALKIWEISPNQQVLLIGSNHPDNLMMFDYSRVALMVQDEETIRQLAKINKKIRVHLKIDTGMRRQGMNVEEFKILNSKLKNYKNIEVEGLMSHLADTDNQEYTKLQIKRFEEAKQMGWESGLTPKYWHLAASAGIEKIPKGLTNAARLGIGMYLGEKPVLRLLSVLTKIGELKKEDRVSYGGTFVAPKKMKFGVVPLGYFEGLDRRLSNKGFVKIGKKFAPILGRVCMNMVVVGLEGIEAKLWDEVEVVSSAQSDKNSIEFMAKIAETIPYDILVGWDGSIRRVVV